jgi:hypothetical protein
MYTYISIKFKVLYWESSKLLCSQFSFSHVNTCFRHIFGTPVTHIISHFEIDLDESIGHLETISRVHMKAVGHPVSTYS